MEDTLSVVRGRGKEATALLARAWSPWRKSQAVQMVTMEGCLVLALVDSSRAVMLVEPIMLPCQGQIMGNPLVTWCMIMFKQFPHALFACVVLYLEFERSVQILLLLVEEDGEEANVENKTVDSPENRRPTIS